VAYVYRHIRIDKNQPFYIGIGSDSQYKRAFEKSRRTNIWNKIIHKTTYNVEILMDGLTWEQACEKEKEFIKLYGRKDLKTGTLVNLTNGGEGALGRKYKMSDETKLKMRNSHLGIKHSDETRLKWSLIRKGRQFSESHKSALKEAAKKRDYKKQGIDSVNKILKTMNVKPFIVYKNGEYFGEFLNRTQCRKEIGVSKTMFFEMLKNEDKSCKGFKIKMK
jgi:hypothetical protein